MAEKPETTQPPTVPAGKDEEPPGTDTSTDWDEWMEEHAGRPRPAPDVADAEGKVKPPR
jgi:hypothetical protein